MPTPPDRHKWVVALDHKDVLTVLLQQEQGDFHVVGRESTQLRRGSRKEAGPENAVRLAHLVLERCAAAQHISDAIGVDVMTT
jgi:hypothetical protein